MEDLLAFAVIVTAVILVFHALGPRFRACTLALLILVLFTAWGVNGLWNILGHPKSLLFFI
jgi:hypothetical protein